MKIELLTRGVKIHCAGRARSFTVARYALRRSRRALIINDG